MPDLSLIQIGMHGDPSVGGLDRYFWGLNEALLRAMPDDALNTFYFGPLGTGIEDSRTHHRLGSADWPLIRRLRAIRRCVLAIPGFKGNRCVVASHFALYALPLLPELAGARHVVHFHGPWGQESAQESEIRSKAAIKTGIERLVFRRATKFITLSKAFRDLLVATYGVPYSRICVIPGGIDLARFQPGDKQSARNRLGWPQDRRILLCVRRLAPRMGLSDLIAGFSAIASRYADVCLVIAGKGLLRNALQSQIDSLGLEKRVRLLGFVSDSSLPTAYQAADFSIVPSKKLEGFGLTTLESLACGTPVLVTPVGGMPEVIGPLSANCVLCGTGSEQIAAGLDQVFSGRLPIPAADTCIDYVRKQFSWARIARRVRAVYEEAVADAG